MIYKYALGSFPVDRFSRSKENKYNQTYQQKFISTDKTFPRGFLSCQLLIQEKNKKYYHLTLNDLAVY